MKSLKGLIASCLLAVGMAAVGEQDDVGAWLAWKAGKPNVLRELAQCQDDMPLTFKVYGNVGVWQIAGILYAHGNRPRAEILALRDEHCTCLRQFLQDHPGVGDWRLFDTGCFGDAAQRTLGRNRLNGCGLCKGPQPKPETGDDMNEQTETNEQEKPADTPSHESLEVKNETGEALVVRTKMAESADWSWNRIHPGETYNQVLPCSQMVIRKWAGGPEQASRQAWEQETTQ